MNKKLFSELFTYNIDTNAYLDMLKKKIIILIENGRQNIILVWDSASTHYSNKADNFYFKSGIERIKWPTKSQDLNSKENILR